MSEMRPAVLKVDGREALKLARKQEDPEVVAALVEAGERYTADEDGTQEVEDIRAGRHPLQRGGRDLDAWARVEARLAKVRERRGDGCFSTGLSGR